jgi:hypothetical protein
MLREEQTEGVRFEVFTAVTVKNIFWDVSPCDSCKNQRFGGTYHLHLQGENNQRIKILAVASDCSTLKVEKTAYRYSWFVLFIKYN